MSIYASDAESHLYFSHNLPFSGLGLFFNVKVLRLAPVNVYVTWQSPLEEIRNIFKSWSTRSIKLESQLHLGYLMGIYALDADFNLYFSQNLPFSGLFYQR